MYCTNYLNRLYEYSLQSYHFRWTPKLLGPRKLSLTVKCKWWTSPFYPPPPPPPTKIKDIKLYYGKPSYISLFILFIYLFWPFWRNPSLLWCLLILRKMIKFLICRPTRFFLKHLISFREEILRSQKRNPKSPIHNEWDILQHEFYRQNVMLKYWQQNTILLKIRSSFKRNFDSSLNIWLFDTFSESIN